MPPACHPPCAAPDEPSCLKAVRDGCELLVQVGRNAGRTACAGFHDGALRVRLQAPPIEGRANAALLQWLARSLVLANILASPLKLLAPLLCGHLAAGAPLVLAGILQRQTAELQAAYAPWVALTVADEDEGWVLLAGLAPKA